MEDSGLAKKCTAKMNHRIWHRQLCGLSYYYCCHHILKVFQRSSWGNRTSAPM